MEFAELVTIARNRVNNARYFKVQSTRKDSAIQTIPMDACYFYNNDYSECYIQLYSYSDVLFNQMKNYDSTVLEITKEEFDNLIK